MIIVMKLATPSEEIERVVEEIRRHRIMPKICRGQHKIVIGLVGETAETDTRQIQNLSPFIEQVIRVNKPFKRTSLEFRYGEASEVVVSTPNKPVIFGQNHPLVVVAGPCSVENEEMIVVRIVG